MGQKDREQEPGGSGFTVRDRRQFTATGERRASEELPAAEPARAASEPAPGRKRPSARPAPVDIDFVAFLQSLYVSSLMALGEVDNPVTHERETNLDLARQNIDILVILREKTRGNLDPDESQFLETIVPQLQLLYATKAG